MDVALACALLCSADTFEKLAVDGKVCRDTVPTRIEDVQP